MFKNKTHPDIPKHFISHTSLPIVMIFIFIPLYQALTNQDFQVLDKCLLKKKSLTVSLIILC